MNNKPNIIYILLDDQRFDAFGFLNEKIQTPNMDEIAKNGVHYRNAFVTTSLCSPSRASILTGLYTHNHHIVDNNKNEMVNRLEYFPELLKADGYQTNTDRLRVLERSSSGFIIGLRFLSETDFLCLNFQESCN